jgi:hypothetical protein
MSESSADRRRANARRGNVVVGGFLAVVGALVVTKGMVAIRAQSHAARTGHYVQRSDMTAPGLNYVGWYCECGKEFAPWSLPLDQTDVDRRPTRPDGKTH